MSGILEVSQGLVRMSGVLVVSRAWCAWPEYWRSVRLGAHVWSTGGQSGLVLMSGILEVSQGLVRMSGVLVVSRAWCAWLEYWRSVRFSAHIWITVYNSVK